VGVGGGVEGGGHRFRWRQAQFLDLPETFARFDRQNKSMGCKGNYNRVSALADPAALYDLRGPANRPNVRKGPYDFRALLGRRWGRAS